MGKRCYIEKCRLWAVLGVGVLSVPGVVCGEEVTFRERDNCAVWKTRGTFFVVKGELFGRNRSIIMEMLEEREERFVLKVRVPIKEFKSGSTVGDKMVYKVLQGEAYPELVFRTEAKTVGEWRELVEKGRWDMGGELNVGGEDYRVVFEMNVRRVEGEEYALKGVCMTRFSELKMKPPRLGGGILAKMDDHLEIHLHMMTREIEGFVL